MLEPDIRAILLEQLRPPGGYRLDAGVATTFTLDFKAALIAPLAFGALAASDPTDPISALEAIQACADRLDIFCQAGQILVPKQAPDLVTFLENMVHPVRRPHAGHLFHPKLWLLRFTADDRPARFRLLCSSRNLVNTAAWDAAVILEGQLGRSVLANSKPLAQLLRQLPAWAIGDLDDERRRRVAGLAHDVERVVWEPPAGVDEVRLHALGLPGAKQRSLTFEGSKRLIIAPFVDAEGLGVLTEGAKQAVLVSRPEALDQLDPASLPSTSSRTLQELLVVDAAASLPMEEADNDVHEGDAPARSRSELSGLHAKVFVSEGYRTQLFVGSANATGAALSGGNVEFVVELQGSKSKLGIGTMLDSGDGLRTILQPYQPVIPPAETKEEQLEFKLLNILRSLAEREFTLRVAPGVNDLFDMTLTASDISIPEEIILRTSLITRPQVTCRLTPQAPGAQFPGVSKADISPFIVLQARLDGVEMSSVVQATLLGEPDGRLDELLARQIDTPEKFLRFLRLLLGFTQEVSAEATALGSGWGQFASRGSDSQPLLESLLQTLHRGGDTLDRVEQAVGALKRHDGGRAIPEGFLNLWSELAQARRMLGKESK